MVYDACICSWYSVEYVCSDKLWDHPIWFLLSMDILEKAILLDSDGETEQ